MVTQPPTPGDFVIWFLAAVILVAIGYLWLRRIGE